jgi:hypothetical protein
MVIQLGGPEVRYYRLIILETIHAADAGKLWQSGGRWAAISTPIYNSRNLEKG